MRALAAVVFLFACGKGKEAAQSTGSAAGSSATGSSAQEAAAPQVELPQVAGSGYVVAEQPARVVATPNRIYVDGKVAIQLEPDGKVPATAVVGDRLPAVIAGLSAPSREPRLHIALDKSLRFELLAQLLRTLESEGLRQFHLGAQRADTQEVVVPIDLPAPAARANVETAPSPSPRPGESARTSAVIEVVNAEVSPESSLSSAIVKSKVSGAYLTALRRCAQASATTDASPGGSLALTFTINEKGRVSEPSAQGAKTDVGECMASAMDSWVFPIPKDANMDGMSVTARLTLELTFTEAPAGEDGGDQRHRRPGSDLEAQIREIREATPKPNARADEPIGIVVSVVDSTILVWSTSGHEGTLSKPKATIAGGPEANRELAGALGEIVKRRWAGKQRTPENMQVTVMFDNAMSMQQVADVLGAVRATPDGTELFAGVVLASPVR